MTYMPKSLSSIFKEIGELETDEEKRAALRSYASSAVRHLVIFAYDAKVKRILPDSAPPYKVNEASDHGEALLYNEAPKLVRIFTDSGFYPQMKTSKRESIFIALLEDLPAPDAELLVAAILGKGFSGIPGEIIKDVYEIEVLESTCESSQTSTASS